MMCEICKKREVGTLKNINDNPFVIPYKSVVGEDGHVHFTNRVVRNICDKCYGKIEKTMVKLMGL